MKTQPIEILAPLTEHDKAEFLRMAESAFQTGRTTVGIRYRDAAMTITNKQVKRFFTLEAGYRAWLCFGWQKGFDRLCDNLPESEWPFIYSVDWNENRRGWIARRNAGPHYTFQTLTVFSNPPFQRNASTDDFRLFESRDAARLAILEMVPDAVFNTLDDARA